MTTSALPSAASILATASLTANSTSELVAEPFYPSPGSWAGAPSALLADGTYWLAYRLRRPVGQGRGYANVIASSADGVHFETLATVTKAQLEAESLERPALTRTDDGTWRLYVSCATPGTKHWRVDVLEAATPEALATAPASTVLSGSAEVGVKDPVILRSGGKWHLWASCHPLEDPAEADRMTTEYATSPDGLDWTWHGTALAGRPGHWDARGARVSAVLLTGQGAAAYYDGRASAAQNWEERTGIAAAINGMTRFAAVGDEPFAGSPYGLGGLRYVSVVPLPDGRLRFYYEVTRTDGAHELRTTVTSVPRGGGQRH